MILRKLAASLLVAGAALAGGALWVGARASAREAAAEARWPAEGQVIRVGERLVHAVVSGSGPDVVLIHGAGGNARDFTFDLVGRLDDRYRVIVFDRPGLGHTPAARDAAWSGAGETPSEQAALLRSAAGALGAERPVVVGHSYGGAVGLAWALDHPEAISAYVSLAGVAMPWEGGLGGYYTLLGSAAGGALVAPAAAALVGDGWMQSAVAGVFAPQPVPQGYLDHFGVPLALRRDTLRANARQVNTLWPQVDAMARRYGDLTLPVEIVHGDRDTTVPLAVHSEPLTRLVPSANLTVLPGVGHMPHHADPQAVVAAIDRAADRAGLR